MANYYRLPLGEKAPQVVNAVIEIPKGSRNKYEYDSELGVFALDRVLASPMFYASDYGFLPQTLAGDGDPVDILVLMEDGTFPGCVVPARPVGMMKMEDKGEDFKVLAVPAKDKRYDQIQDLGDVAPHLLKEIEHFFASYKTLENAFPTVEGWCSAQEARDYIESCRKTFSEKSLVS